MKDWHDPLNTGKGINDDTTKPEEKHNDVDPSKRPIKPEDKRVVNGTTDINQLAPFRYPWAWEYFLNANSNHWTPLDISMVKDISDFNQKLTNEEKHVYTNVLAYLTTSDILAMRNIGLAVMEKMTAPELQIYQARQVYEECVIEGHELLEKTKGWVDINDIVIGDEVFSYDAVLGYNVFTEVQRTQEYLYTGILHQFKSEYMEQIVTNNHRMPSIGIDNTFEITKAKDLRIGKQVVDFITPMIGFNKLYNSVCDEIDTHDYKEFIKDILSKDNPNKSSTVDHSTVTKMEVEVEDTPVYCVTVPTGVFYVRYNNKVTLTGNSLHTWTYQSCIENLSIDQSEIYNRYRTVPALNNKIEMANRRLSASLSSNIDLKNRDNLEEFVMSYLFFAAIFEGCWFYNGFSPIYALQRRGLMLATGEQFQYINRDESVIAGTECLTPRGWVKIEDYRPTDLMAQWVPPENMTDKGILEFVTPIKISTHIAKGYYTFEDSDGLFNQAVTKKHRMVYWDDNGNVETTYAEYFMPDKDTTMPISAPISIEETTDCVTTLIPYERFLIVLHTNGVIGDTINDYIETKFTLPKENHRVELFIDIIDRCGFIYIIEESGSGYNKRVHITVSVPKSTIDTLSTQLSDWVYENSRDCLWYNNFVSELKSWEWSSSESKDLVYINISMDEINAVSYISTLAGYSSIIEHSSNTNHYVLRIIGDRYILSGSTITKNFIDEEARFYGPEVPSGFVIMRYKGAISITGNSLHASFGIRVVKQIMLEEDIKLDPVKVQEMFDEAHECELEYANYILRDPILGYSAEDHIGQFRFLANRRAREANQKEPFPGAKNVLPWLDEQININKESNFFEVTPKEYRTGVGLNWDE